LKKKLIAKTIYVYMAAKTPNKQPQCLAGKGDGEGVSMKAQKQQLSLVQKGEKAMEANMNAGDCKV